MEATKDPQICERCGAAYDATNLRDGMCWNCECEDNEAIGVST